MDRGNEEAKPLLLEQKQQLMLRERFVKYNLVYEFMDSCAHKAVTTVLAIFFLESLHFNENAAAQLVHLYIYGSYGSCIIGSLVSHGCLGIYITTYLFAIMQIGGYMLLMMTTISELPSRALIVFVALMLSALGFGANRTCFITFGCEQVVQSVERKARGVDSPESRLDLISGIQKAGSQQYLAAIMMSNQAGYIVSTFVTPLIRVHGAGSYFFVFLVPVCAKTLGTLAFWFGNKFVFSRSDFKNLDTRSGERRQAKNQKETGMDSGDEISTQLIDTGSKQTTDSGSRTWEDWIALGSALVVLLPLILFAALGSQTASTWIFQGRRMNGNVHVPWLGTWTIPPDQMPVIGQIFTVTFIPLLEMVIYPFVNKYIMKLTSLRKLVCSLLLATLAFLLSGVLQIAIDSQVPKTGAQHADISILWQIPQFAALAFAEAFFLISVSHFAYHEAPRSMKSAVAGFLHSFLGFGNVVTIAVIAVLGPHASKVEESFVFASIGAFGAFVMAVLSYCYVSREARESRKQEEANTP